MSKDSYIIPRLGIDSFDWSAWRSGAHIWLKLGIHPRLYSIMEEREKLRRYAVGYIPAEKPICRPTIGEIAVMFLIDGIFGWTHLRKEEFEYVFRS